MILKQSTLDSHFFIEFEERPACELRTVVSDDPVWHSEAEDNPLDELDGWVGGSCPVAAPSNQGEP